MYYSNVIAEIFVMPDLDWPGKLKDIAEEVGDDATTKLVSLFGGTRIYIPKKVCEGHQLLDLGEMAFLSLVEMFGGMYITVPKATHREKGLRNQNILNQRGCKSVTTLAREYKLTDRQVWNILRNNKSNAPTI
jgi:Mor family transcriptional regulator